jgi:hypothetical protein
LILLGGSALAALLPSAAAQAQLWNPLSIKVKPNMVVGVDTSVTMQVTPDCSGCHSFWLSGQFSSTGDPFLQQPWSATRLNTFTTQLADTLGVFKDQFIYGGFRYNSCDYAKVEYRVLPDTWYPNNSWQQTMDLVTAVIPEPTKALPIPQYAENYDSEPGYQFCDLRENHKPSVNLTRITPNGNGDDDVLSQMVNGHFPGLTLTDPFGNPIAIPGSVGCDLPHIFSSFDPKQYLKDRLRFFRWPHWQLENDGGGGPFPLTKPDAVTVEEYLCEGLRPILRDMAQQIYWCDPEGDDFPPQLLQLLAGIDVPAATSMVGGNWAFCDPVAIAQQICAPGSPAENTCICHAEQDGCSDRAEVTECGVPYSFDGQQAGQSEHTANLSRQQVAVCEAYSTAAGDRFGSYFRSQPENRVNMNGCRQNAALFFTDALDGRSPGVASEATNALSAMFGAPYASMDNPPTSNMSLFHVSTQFSEEAQTMANALNGGSGGKVYDATSETTMKYSFQEIVNKTQKGVYAGSGLTYNDDANAGEVVHQGRVAEHILTVPGREVLPGAPDETYIQRPSRIAWYPVNTQLGVVSTQPLCETDWAERVVWPGMAHGGCPSGGGPACLNGLGDWMAPNDQQGPAVLGPAVMLNDWSQKDPSLSFPNGVKMMQDIPANVVVDRGAPGPHPELLYGFQFGGGTTRPVVVSAGRDAGNGLPNPGAFTSWETSYARNRPRTIYTVAGSYLIAYHAGEYTDAAATTMQPFTYKDDLSTNVCRELFRYRPIWVRPSPDLQRYTINNVAPQDMINGQMTVREAQIGNSGTPSDFATVLAMAQGTVGSGMATLDITDPYAPRILREWGLGPAIQTPDPPLPPPGGIHRPPLPVPLGPPSLALASSYTPGARATSEPVIYQFTNNSVVPPVTNAFVLMTTGLHAKTTPRLFAYAAVPGGPNTTDPNPLDHAIALPGGTDYPTAPVCIDSKGDGLITDCYLLGRNGTLVRIGVAAGRLDANNINDISSLYAKVDPREQFWSRPGVYFGNDNKVNITFASGDLTDLTRQPVCQNNIYRIVDASNQVAVNPQFASAASICQPANDGAVNSGTYAVIPMASAGEVAVNPPVIAKGVVAFTTYAPPTDICAAGQGYIYAMNYQSCQDAATGGQRPQQIWVQNGIPTQPVILRDSGKIAVTTSGNTSPISVNTNLNLRGGGHLKPQPVYWRMEARAL